MGESASRSAAGRSLAIVGLGLCALFGCSSPFSPAAHVSGCADGTAVHASTGLTPRFTWGGCKVAVVGVEPVDANGAATGSAVWSINGESDANGIRNNLIESGVAYGAKPKLTTTGVGATPLHSGQRYRAFIWMTGPSSTFGFAGGGEGFFVP
jgi:hypothetical protein